MAGEIYLDTHVIVWLYAGEVDKLSALAKENIRNATLVYSSVVKLELSYLFEIGRLKIAPDVILQGLGNEIGLVHKDSALGELIGRSLQHQWTRDPFDRLIASQADLLGLPLLTKDETIRDNFDRAVW